MISVALAPKLWPVPAARPEYRGLFDQGDNNLVPVLDLTAQPQSQISEQQLVAILHVRGEPVGLCIDRAGRVYDDYQILESTPDKTVSHVSTRRGQAGTNSNNEAFWLVDPDALWPTDSRDKTGLITSEG